MAVELKDIDALRSYLKEKNLLLPIDGEERDRPKSVLMPYQWKWEDIEPVVVASGKLVRLAENAEDKGGVARRDTHFLNPRHTNAAAFPMRIGIQYVGAGEQAYSHRHTTQATRFVI